MTEDYYQLLGINRTASAEEIRKAYHKLALKHHPDRNPGDKDASERFRKIHEAYQVLSDLRKRSAYEREQSSIYAGNASMIVFLDAEIDSEAVKLNEEVSLIYRFGAEGRFFRKPDLRGFFIAAGPLVDHRMAVHDAVPVRETILRYVVCPVITGPVELGPASIRYGQQTFQSNRLKLNVEANACYFSKGETAGASPLKMYLYKEQLSSNTVYAKMMLIEHAVLIPRSDVAAWYHRTGRIIKVATALCGAAWALVNRQGLLNGFVLGSLLGGINCHLMYRMAGIRPRFYYAERFPLVKIYREQGYRLGRNANEGFGFTEIRSFIKSLFM